MNNIVLVGFMGSGKSTVGRELAAQLHRPFIDLDQEIEAGAGRSVTEIFAADGETAFRERESRCLERALQAEGAVVAAGGGAPLREQNWRRIRDGNTVVALMAEPAELRRRLHNGNGRPLLGKDPAAAIATLLPQRIETYLGADLIVSTDGSPVSEVAVRIVQALPASGLSRIAFSAPSGGRCQAEIVVGRQLGSVIASTLHRLRPSGPVLMITAAAIGESHAEVLRSLLASAGVQVVMHVLPDGERAKDLHVLGEIYQSMAWAGLDRDGLVLVLGGGTVGDVGGFAAATWMRGIRYVQVPTTLLAMVDSSIGGKTAINLPAGKNLVGAVHQPSAILCDLDYLTTLPDDEYRAALAEVIKAALIADGGFAAWLGNNLEGVLQREPAAVQEAVTRAIAIKVGAVEQDPFETGPRARLNYGHTVGHALERALGYGRIRHGEAVAWGMEVASRISLLSSACRDGVVEAQHALLSAAHLLDERPTVSRADLLAALRHDKKTREGEPRWVLLEDVGRAVYGRRIEPAIVDTALSEVLGI